MKRHATLTLEVEAEMKDIGKRRWGASKQADLDAYYADICRVFGPPNTDVEETSTDHKVDVEWQGLINGEPFTIHNYKDGPRYLGNAGTPIVQITHWTIGAHHARTGTLVKHFFYARTKKGAR